MEAHNLDKLLYVFLVSNSNFPIQILEWRKLKPIFYFSDKIQQVTWLEYQIQVTRSLDLLGSITYRIRLLEPLKCLFILLYCGYNVIIFLYHKYRLTSLLYVIHRLWLLIRLVHSLGNYKLIFSF